MSVLSLNNVKKSYKLGDGSEFPVLKGINVSFDKGELVSIIGESGSGKSTLMNIIGGLDSKFEGEVLVDGKNIGAFTEKELDIYRKNKIGFIFQDYNLLDNMTLQDNIALPLSLNGIKSDEVIERTKQIAALFKLSNHLIFTNYSISLLSILYYIKVLQTVCYRPNIFKIAILIEL